MTVMTSVRLARLDLMSVQSRLSVERSPALVASQSWPPRVLFSSVLSLVALSNEALCTNITCIAFDASKAVEMSLQVAFS